MPRHLLTWLYAGALALTLGAWQWEHHQRVVAESALLVSQRLDSATTIRVASAKAPIAPSVKAAAKTVRGRVIASVTVQIPARDTAVAHANLPTAVQGDSTRHAEFRDSTFAGVVEGEVTAPPCCAPLALTYRIHRPAFAPSIGFIQAGARYAAVVTWQGEQAQVGTPFVTQHPTGLRRLAPFAQATWSPDGTWSAAAGMEGRFLGVRPVLQLEQRFVVGEPLRLSVGVRKVF